MNNDKPSSESQQTDINRLQFEAKLSEFISSQQSIPPDIAKVVREHFWDLIEDTRKAQPSHIPTEQPGDAKHTWKVGGTNENYGNLRQYSTAVFDDIECVGRSIAFTYEESRQRAELIARAPALLSEVSTLRSKQAELVAENARLKAECSSHEKERYEIYSFDSSQAMEIKALQKELEQLRSERDKLKSDRDAWKGMIAPILDFCQQHGKSLGIRPGESIPEKVLEILKSALSGGSKQ